MLAPYRNARGRMGRFRTWVSHKIGHRVQALVEPRLAEAEAVWAERLAAVSDRMAAAEQCARQARVWREQAHEASSADLRALMMRLDGIGLRVETLARRVESEAACRQVQSDRANGDITAMLHRLEQVRRDLRHELAMPADG